MVSAMKRSRRAFLRATALAGAGGAAGCSQNKNGTQGGPNTGNGGGNDDGTSTSTGGPGDGTPTNDQPAGTPTAKPVGTSERWATFQFDLRNTGSVPLYHAGFDGAERRWSTDFGETKPTQPVFDEERLYVSTGGALYSLDRASQERHWRFDAGNESPSAPALDDRGFVYVVTRNGVFKFDAEEGWSAWEFNFGEEFPNVISVVAKSAPVLHGDTVIFNIVVKTSGGGPSTVSRVVGIDAKTGSFRWQAQTSREATAPETVYAPTPAVAGNKLYFTAGHDKRDAALYAVNATNGNGQWSRNYKGKGWSSVCVKDGIIYFADKFVQIFTTSGDKIVRRTVDPPPNAYAVAAGQEYVFMSSRVYGGNEGSLFAVDDTGRVQWTFEGEGNLYVPAVTEETVYVASGSGALIALAQSDGLVRWRHDLGLSGTAIASAPAISSEEVYVAAGRSNEQVTLYSVAPV